MRRLRRPQLGKKTARFLTRRTKKVAGAVDPRAKAAKLWKKKQSKAITEIRGVLRTMASGLERCMYCEDSQGTAIDHFRPIAAYPGSAFEWTNYLLACSHCNSNEKRDQFPLDTHGNPLLIDPTADDPRDHLVLSPRTGKWVPITDKGKVSIQVFGLDRGILETGRLDAWVSMEQLIVRYDQLVTAGDAVEAERVKATLQRHPFSSVLLVLLDLTGTPGTALIGADCLAALNSRPEIRTWVSSGD